MKERPILFSGAMVRALLAGTKTQTRRVVKAKHLPWIENRVLNFLDGKWNQRPLPYGQTGDRLWVRESWQYYDWTDDGLPCVRFAADNGTAWTKRIPQEQADRLTDIWAGLSSPENYQIDNRARDRRWRPSIHMPRWASRITLEVTGVRVERLQDISEADARAEGALECDPVSGREVLLAGASQRGSFVLHYRDIWESINGAGSWDANPWVWVIEFRHIEAQGGAAC